MKVITVPPHIKASEGRAFTFGQTNIYVGPRDPEGSAGRNLKRPPVLAYARPGYDTPVIVSEFPNAAAAEQFMTALMTGVDEMAAAAGARPTAGSIAQPLTFDTELAVGGTLHESGSDSFAIIADLHAGEYPTDESAAIPIGVRWIHDPHDDRPDDEIEIEQLVIDTDQLDRWAYTPPRETATKP